MSKNRFVATEFRKIFSERLNGVKAENKICVLGTQNGGIIVSHLLRKRGLKEVK
jgi:hypothetical protein